MEKNYWLPLALIVCSAHAGADILLTGRTSSSSAGASHQTLNGPQDGYGTDSDSSVQLIQGRLGSSATASPYEYGALAWSDLSFSANSLTVSGNAYAGEIPNGSFSNASSHSQFEVTFSVDNLTHVDIRLGEDRLGAGSYSSGLLQLFRGNTQLISLKSETDYNYWIKDPQYLSLDLLAGDYRIVGNFNASTYYGTCPYPSCGASASMLLTTSANVSAVPVPAAAWLMGSGLAVLFGVMRRRKS